MFFLRKNKKIICLIKIILINSFFDFSNYFFHFPYQRKPNFIKNKIRLPHFKITLINSCYTS